MRSIIASRVVYMYQIQSTPVVVPQTYFVPRFRKVGGSGHFSFLFKWPGSIEASAEILERIHKHW